MMWCCVTVLMATSLNAAAHMQETAAGKQTLLAKSLKTGQGVPKSISQKK